MMPEVVRDVDPFFAPLKIRSVALPNRIVMAPMTRNYSPGGVPGTNIAEYYAKRAAGGAGLIITEGVGIDHPASLGEAGLGESAIPVMHGSEALAGWKRVVQRVHACGGIIFPQLWHMGVMKAPGTGMYPDAPPVRPSGIWGPEGRHHTLPAAYVSTVVRPTMPASEETIQDVVDSFQRAARDAMSIGFDGIAMHGAHGYLIDNFLWAETNLRNDRWGGSLMRRSRFPVEVVRAIRAAIGPDTPILLRFSQWKQQDYRARLAVDPQELETILSPLADAGVDIFDASTRYFDRAEFPGSNLGLAGWAKKVTGKLSMAVGGIGVGKGDGSLIEARVVSSDNTDLAAARMSRREFDLLGVGRALLSDPNWPMRLRSGQKFLHFDPSSLLELR